MCKIFTLTNMSKIKKIDTTINTIAEHLARYERHGFGYAIQGASGVFGERTLTPDSFKTCLKSEVLSFPFLSQDYSRIGVKSKALGAGIFHGRTSTNDKTIGNTHPLVKHEWTLIHNGVVTNTGPKYVMDTTNDTEHLVQYMGTTGLDSLVDNLTGYYAFCAIAPDGRLHVVRDAIAPLYMARIETIDSYVFATTKELIQDICKDLKWTHSVIAKVNDNTSLVLLGNTIESMGSIKSRGYGAIESKYASLSLGRELETYKPDDLARFNDDGKEYFTESQKNFLTEVNTYADASYTFKDYDGNDLTSNEFHALIDDEKLYCTVIRGDGTIVCPDDYEKEVLYGT